MGTSYVPPEERPWKRDFFTIWGGQTFSILGSSLVQFALIWYLTKTTQSAVVLATASIVALLPQVILGPFAGAIVDRGNRRRIMIAADGSIAAATLVLFALFFLGMIQPWHIYAVMFVRSLASAFHYPAMTASTSLMIPKEHLTRIQGINQMMSGGINIIAAPLGALLLEVLDVQGILLIDIVTALIAITPLLFIAIPQPAIAPAANGSGLKVVWEDLKDGFRYVRGWRGLMALFLVATGINFVLSPAFTLLPLLVNKYFGLGAVQLGWIEAAFGIGIVIGGLVLGAWGGFKRKIITSLCGLLLIAVSMAAIGLIPATAFPLAIGVYALTGFGIPFTNGPVFAIIQGTVDPQMQ
ncbi:MAG TPA: MFS transporter, partial [Bellilinea sp.]